MQGTKSNRAPLQRRVGHKSNATTTLQRPKALALSAKLVEWAMTEDTKKFLAALTILTNNALKSLGEFRGALDALSSRVEEIDAIQARLAAEKTQLANVRAQREAAEQQLQKTSENLARLLDEVSVPASKMHEIRTQLAGIKT
jgi:hypothetical protein